jgi:PLP dependent protein
LYRTEIGSTCNRIAKSFSNPLRHPINREKTAEIIRNNWNSIVNRCSDAAQRVGRSSKEFKIIGVTKYVDIPTTRVLVETGCRDLGESRPQLLWEKSDALLDLKPRWHMIGHLQRNKVKRTLSHLTFLHSLDSQRLMEQVQRDSVPSPPNPISVLLEVNVSGDPSKTGLTHDDAIRLLDWWVPQMPNPQIELVGLMGMSSLDGGESQARKDFQQLRTLRDTWSLQTGLPLRELSMGMSGDFEVAIEEGSTMVRIGSALFEGINRHG